MPRRRASDGFTRGSAAEPGASFHAIRSDLYAVKDRDRWPRRREQVLAFRTVSGILLAVDRPVAEVRGDEGQADRRESRVSTAWARCHGVSGPRFLVRIRPARTASKKRPTSEDQTATATGADTDTSMSRCDSATSDRVIRHVASARSSTS